MYRRILAILAIGTVAVICTAPLVVVPSPQCYALEDEWEKDWNRRQPPDQIMNAVGIKSGMVVAEIGAGKGRYAVQVAGRVGPDGKVYAEDIDAEALEYVETRCKRDGIKNIETILGEVTDAKLPAGSCDFIYCINTYHHIEKPVPLLRNVVPAFKPSGKLVIIEHDPGKVKGLDYGYHCMPPDTVLAHAAAAGYELLDRHSFLELDEIYVFQVKSEEKPAE